MTPSERKVLEDAEEEARQIAEAFDEDGTTGIQPEPIIEETEVELPGDLFGFGFEDEPEAQAFPRSTSGTPTGGCSCSCPREVTEISGWTMAGYVQYTGDGVNQCLGETCSFSGDWTRIDSTDTFTTDHQFKLYVDEPCTLQGFPDYCGTIYYEDNTVNIQETCSVTNNEFDFINGIIKWDANLNAIINDVPPFVTFRFFVSGDNFCSSLTATYPDTDIIFPTSCDLSNLIGTYSVSDDFTDGFGGIWHVEGTIEIF